MPFFDTVKAAVIGFFGEGVCSFEGSDSEGLCCEVPFQLPNRRNSYGILTVGSCDAGYSVSTRRSTKEGSSLSELFAEVIFSNNTNKGITGSEIQAQ